MMRRKKDEWMGDVEPIGMGNVLGGVRNKRSLEKRMRIEMGTEEKEEKWRRKMLRKEREDVWRGRKEKKRRHQERERRQNWRGKLNT